MTQNPASCVLTLLGAGRPRRHFLVGVNRGFRGQAVELFAADQMNLLKVFHLLLQKYDTKIIFSWF